MDFGDILNQGEGGQKKQPAKKQAQVSHKKAKAPTKEEKEASRPGYSWEQVMEQDRKKQMNPMDIWLNRHGTVDKDKITEEAERKEKFSNIDYLRSMKPEATIDLHQLTREEAWAKLKNFVDDCYRRNFKKIMIIHGKGIHSASSDPVLGPMVRMFIETDKRLGTSGHPDRNHGGNGATWVIIRDEPKK